MNKKGNSSLFILIFAAVLSAFAALVTDLYLPALPVLSEAFETNASSVQLSLTVSLVGLAAGQLLFGPISDKMGRRTPLLISLVIFLLATIGCIYAVNIASFIGFRLLQGFAGAGGIVISRSVAVDLYENDKLAKFLSTLAVANGLTPIVAPVAGALLLNITDWRGIFIALLLMGILISGMSFFYRETLVPEKRFKGNLFQTFHTFGVVLRNKTFVYYTLALGCTMGMFFSYLSASPFIFQTFYNIIAFVYGVFFWVNSVGHIIGSRIVTRFSDLKQAVMSGSVVAIAIAVLIALFLAINASVYIVETAFFILLISVGIILPAATALALNLERENSGSASALLGFFQFLAGGIVSPLVGIGNIMYATGFMIVICALLSLVFIKKANPLKAGMLAFIKG